MNWRTAAESAWIDLEALRDDPGYALVRREIIACLATRPGYRAPAARTPAAQTPAQRQAAEDEATRQRYLADRESRMARADDSQRMFDEASEARLDASVDRSRAQRARSDAEAYDASKREAELRRRTAGLASREQLEREQQGVGDEEPPREGRFYTAARRLRVRLDAAIARARELARTSANDAARRTADAAGQGLARVVAPLAGALDGVAAGTRAAVASVGVGVGLVLAGAALLYFLTNRKG